MQRQQRRNLFFVALAVVILAVGVGGTAVATSGRAKVARHVTLAGHSIAGLDRARLTARVKQLDRSLRTSKVKVIAPKGGFTIKLSEMGAAVDVGRTVDGALAVGHTGNPLSRVWGAFKALFTKRSAPVEVTIDRAVLRPAVTAHDPGPKVLSKEPSLTRKSGVFVAVAGSKGSGIDPRDVAAALPDAVSDGAPIIVRVGRGTVQPQYSLADAESLAREANKLGRLSLQVSAGDETKTIDPSMLATWIDALPTPEALLLGVSGDRAAADLSKMFADVGQSVVQTRYAIGGDGSVAVTPGVAGTKCCDAPQLETLLTAAIRKPPARPIVLPMKVSEPAITAADVQAFAIKELVGTFTTKHPCCAPRVSNIHRIADIVRGTVIRPHTRLSINGLVGPRTTAKGFVVDHVIEDGKFSEAVGGGISQFATTLFNASFFAGLDVPEYQSHSIYISRYPYGREATLNFPHPDLIIANNTPYGVLIWPSYTGTTLTVSLYSTKYAPGTQTGQSQAPSGVCTRVTTERTRTFPDGTNKIDHFTAVYRPQEGKNCDGSGSAVTTTTRPKKSTATTRAPSPATTSSPTTAP
ncbi:MAG: hypothetical protein QOJ00_508 [Actinomycetota bacterium]|jgi:vancomycin resistance protein YoaR